MTIENYMQYLGIAFGTAFVFLAVVAIIFLSFTCFIAIKDACSFLQDRQPDTLIFPMQLKRKDEEIEKLQKELKQVKMEIHETKQYAGKAFSDVLYSGQASDKNEVIKIALAGLEKMRP
jgi:hypothetical protein